MLSAKLGNGKLLPSWVQFNARKAHFVGRTPHSNKKTLKVEVKATDSAGLSVSDNFKIKHDDK